MITIRKQLLVIAALAVLVLSGQAIYAQNVKAPSEPTTRDTELPKGPSSRTRAIQILLEALTRIICEEAGNCPGPIETPAESAEPPGFSRRGPRMATGSNTRSAAPSFGYHKPNGWQAYEERSSVTIAPPSEYVNGNLSNGVMFGFADLNGAGFESGSERYLQEMLAANSYLQRVGQPERNSDNFVSCITTRFAGMSPATSQMENVVVHTCRRTAQKLFYAVNVNSGPNATRYDEENNRIIQSIRFR